MDPLFRLFGVRFRQVRLFPGSLLSNSLPHVRHRPNQSLKRRQSKWTPPPGQFTAVDHYIDQCRREMNQIDFERRLARQNLSYDEQQALQKLKNRTDVVIRQPDKGGALFTRRTDLHIAGDKKQLADQQFYEKIPSDATQSSQQEVKSFINTAIESNQLPPSATNLIVRTPTYLQILLVTQDPQAWKSR